MATCLTVACPWEGQQLRMGSLAWAWSLRSPFLPLTSPGEGCLRRTCLAAPSPRCPFLPLTSLGEGCLRCTCLAVPSPRVLYQPMVGCLRCTCLAVPSPRVLYQPMVGCLRCTRLAAPSLREGWKARQELFLQLACQHPGQHEERRDGSWLEGKCWGCGPFGRCGWAHRLRITHLEGCECCFIEEAQIAGSQR